jgi:AraC family transcriptional regulator of adaptative response/methylated-DNA-[protein]-cysteine methyltransferase
MFDGTKRVESSVGLAYLWGMLAAVERGATVEEDVAGSQDDLWRAVEARDRAADGAFVYGVRSTGIYCRPSCPSRRPRRQHVVFFPVPDAAEGAGYRSCRRCRPRSTSPDAGAAAVERACRLIEARHDQPLRLRGLAAEVSLSPRHFHRTFLRLTGVTPRQYADACRLRALRSHLRAGKPVADATYEAGYGSSSRLYERAAAQLGMTPAAYRKGAPGQELAFATAPCRLGTLLVAATARGVASVRLGDHRQALVQGLRDEFPKATVRPDADALARWLAPILRSVEHGVPCAGLPLDVRATAFQRRVWEELRRIPLGQTRSYGEIARRVGRPGAGRAVGRACASNPVAIVVPCHRVVPGSGGLGGYRWGAARKRALLDREVEAGGRAARAR